MRDWKMNCFRIVQKRPKSRKKASHSWTTAGNRGPRGVVERVCDGDGLIGIVDFLAMLAVWGPCGDCGVCLADLDGDCVVGIADLLILLASWS